MTGRVKYLLTEYQVTVGFNVLSSFLHFTDFHSEHIIFINRNNKRN